MEANKIIITGGATRIGAAIARKLSGPKKEIGDVLESVYEKDYVKVGTDENIGGNLKKHLKALNKRMKESATNL